MPPPVGATMALTGRPHKGELTELALASSLTSVPTVLTFYTIKKKFEIFNIYFVYLLHS